MALTSKAETASSRIWTRVTDSISYVNNRYTKNAKPEVTIELPKNVLLALLANH